MWKMSVMLIEFYWIMYVSCFLGLPVTSNPILTTLSRAETRINPVGTKRTPAANCVRLEVIKKITKNLYWVHCICIHSLSMYMYMVYIWYNICNLYVFCSCSCFCIYFLQPLSLHFFNNKITLSGWTAPTRR